MLEMNTDFRESILVIEIEGALDSRTAADFRSWLLEKILQGHREILLNFRDLEYLSSAGITSLLEIKRNITTQKGKMAITQASPEVERLLSFFGILREIPIVSNIDEFKKLKIENVEKEENSVPEEKPIGKDTFSQSKPEEGPKSELEKPIQEEPQRQEQIIPCPNCHSPLRIYQKGKYLCPICHFVFTS